MSLIAVSEITFLILGNSLCYNSCGRLHNYCWIADAELPIIVRHYEYSTKEFATSRNLILGAPKVHMKYSFLMDWRNLFSHTIQCFAADFRTMIQLPQCQYNHLYLWLRCTPYRYDDLNSLNIHYKILLQDILFCLISMPQNTAYMCCVLFKEFTRISNLSCKIWYIIRGHSLGIRLNVPYIYINTVFYVPYIVLLCK